MRAAESPVADTTEGSIMQAALTYATNRTEQPHARSSLEDPGRSLAGRVAAAPLERPLLRLIAVRAKPCGVGGGLTARDMITDAEPW